jgi:hypothetical protein
MGGVLTSPLQEVQQWLDSPSQRHRRDKCARVLKPTAKDFTCKQGCAPYFASEDGRAESRAFRIAHYKTAKQWEAKSYFEDLIVQALAAAPAKVRDIESEFNKQAEKWDSETAYISSTPKKILHESYQSIMAMGPDVVPYLLRDLQKTGRSWFWALRHLTRTNPVATQDQGNLDKMISAWVSWGKREGII